MDRGLGRPRDVPKSSRKGRRRGGRPGRGRLLATAAIVLAVLLGTASLHLYVAITTRFEGRLWDLPSRVYSDRLLLRPGAFASAPAVARRLARAGYVSIEGAPARPGEFRRRGETIDVHLRSSEGPWGRSAAGRVRLGFSENRLRALSGDGGRPVASVTIEPELLALLAGPRQEERDVVALSAVPDRLVRAVLAAEDARFYAHPGIDPLAVARAAAADVRRAKIVQGGSTITQQTVKNLFLGTERTWWRKFREALMAVILDLRYSKERILEVYLNEVYLGQRGPVSVCGVAAAARFYFGRNLSDLSLGEAALLAGLIRNPGGYNPFVHPESALARRGQVLGSMVELGWIAEDDARAASREPLRLAGEKVGHSRAPWVADLVRTQLTELYGADVLSREGLRIYTSVDPLLQEVAQEAIAAGLSRLEERRASRRGGGGALQAALVALDPSTGAILALVGGRDYRRSQFNRVVQARRQPGSCFKPFVYLAGFEAGVLGRSGALTPASLLEDEPLEIDAGRSTYRPSNYDGLFRGPVTARRALEESLNVVAVRAAQHAGLREVARTAERCGLPRFEPYPSLALGACEVTPLDLASAYCVFANGGLRTSAEIVREVTTRDGERIERQEPRRRRAVSAEAAYLLTDVLRGVLDRGTAASSRELGLEGNAAGKTGTTDDTRDSWFVGYTPGFLALVWVGRDDNRPTGLTGASGALPIWVDFMRRARRMTDAPFPEPEGIERVTIDPATGLLAVAGCPDRVEEVFASGTAPEDECEMHRRGVAGWFERLFRRGGDRTPREPGRSGRTDRTY